MLEAPRITPAENEAGPIESHDKIKLKTGNKELGIRVVQGAVARYGADLSSGVIMIPSYVNIGAYVDSGTMVDTWATVGSCAQIGKRKKSTDTKTSLNDALRDFNELHR